MKRSYIFLSEKSSSGLSVEIWHI